MNYKIEEIAPNAILLDGLEEAIIGIAEEFGNGSRIVYSKEKIINILCNRDLMTVSEAEEFYDYNILGLYAGEQNPIFLEFPLKPIKKGVVWEYEYNEI